MNFGANLKHIRKEQQLSQEALAELLDVSRQSISKWEQDICYPEAEKLLLLSKVLNVSFDELMQDKDKETKDQQEKSCIGGIRVYSPTEHIVAHCYTVISSGEFKGGEGCPKYALFAVEEQSHAFWGQARVFLGWYAKEADIALEISGVNDALEVGASNYELKYSVKTKRQGWRMKIVEE